MHTHQPGSMRSTLKLKMKKVTVCVYVFVGRGDKILAIGLASLIKTSVATTNNTTGNYR